MSCRTSLSLSWVGIFVAACPGYGFSGGWPKRRSPFSSSHHRDMLSPRLTTDAVTLITRLRKCSPGPDPVKRLLSLLYYDSLEGWHWLQPRLHGYLLEAPLIFNTMAWYFTGFLVPFLKEHILESSISVLKECPHSLLICIYSMNVLKPYQVAQG